MIDSQKNSAASGTQQDKGDTHTQPRTDTQLKVVTNPPFTLSQVWAITRSSPSPWFSFLPAMRQPAALSRSWLSTLQPTQRSWENSRRRLMPRSQTRCGYRERKQTWGRTMNLRQLVVGLSRWMCLCLCRLLSSTRLWWRWSTSTASSTSRSDSSPSPRAWSVSPRQLWRLTASWSQRTWLSWSPPGPCTGTLNCGPSRRNLNLRGTERTTPQLHKSHVHIWFTGHFVFVPSGSARRTRTISTRTCTCLLEQGPGTASGCDLLWWWWNWQWWRSCSSTASLCARRRRWALGFVLFCSNMEGGIRTLRNTRRFISAGLKNQTP